MDSPNKRVLRAERRAYAAAAAAAAASAALHPWGAPALLFAAPAAVAAAAATARRDVVDDTFVIRRESESALDPDSDDLLDILQRSGIRSNNNGIESGTSSDYDANSDLNSRINGEDVIETIVDNNVINNNNNVVTAHARHDSCETLVIDDDVNVDNNNNDNNNMDIDTHNNIIADIASNFDKAIALATTTIPNVMSKSTNVKFTQSSVTVMMARTNVEIPTALELRVAQSITQYESPASSPLFSVVRVAYFPPDTEPTQLYHATLPAAIDVSGAAKDIIATMRTLLSLPLDLMYPLRHNNNILPSDNDQQQLTFLRDLQLLDVPSVTSSSNINDSSSSTLESNRTTTDVLMVLVNALHIGIPTRAAAAGFRAGYLLVLRISSTFNDQLSRLTHKRSFASVF